MIMVVFLISLKSQFFILFNIFLLLFINRIAFFSIIYGFIVLFHLPF